jgi:uncharacterized protein with HEPN domain
MPLDEQAKSYLWDIREAAREIDDFMRGIKFHQFEKNKMLRYAVERQLHIIGEAAHHVSPQFRKSILKSIGKDWLNSVMSLPMNMAKR